jgi:hypothetical protein
MNICKKITGKLTKNPGIPRRKQGIYVVGTFGTGRLKIQYCGTGSGIRCLFDPWIGDRGLVKNQDPDPG